MQRALFTVVVLFALAVPAIAQEQVFCGSDEILRAALEANPEIAKAMDALDRESRMFTRSRVRSLSTQNYVVPVVVYIVHAPTTLPGTAENITDQQVLSQIAALNQAFATLGIEFCLATKDATNGTPFTGSTPGIIRVSSPLTDHFTAQEGTLKTTTSTLPGDRYLRIWVVQDIDNQSGVAGYARFPGSVPPALDGIVMRYDVFGDISTCGCTLLPNYDRGRILAHEVGHYLNLHHPFQGGCTGMFPNDCATSGDRVCDTPQLAVATTGCPGGFVQSCDGSGALIHNEMDYTNDVCRNSFTTDQGTRMLAALNLSRALLVSPSNLVATGVSCAGANAAFAVDHDSPCTNALVTFDAANTAGATYAWNFGDGGTANGDPVTHTYATPGTYTASVTVTSGSNSVTSAHTIIVTSCPPIASSQGNWYFGNNAGLDFSSGSPTPALGAYTNHTIGTLEGCVSQSDAAGNLLFYSDGINVWDRNHLLINPVTPLTGHNSSSQSALSVPFPGNPNRYYLFTIPSKQFDASSFFAYSIIDVTGGNATMIAAKTPVPLPAGATAVSEAATAIEKCNGDSWVIVRGYFNDPAPLRNSFYVYSVTSGGVTLAATYPFANRSFVGQLKASPDGTRIANSGGAVVMCSFDRATGVISNPVNFNKGDYGITFSPDSRVFYIADWLSNAPAVYQTIYQYDLQDPNPPATEKIVATTPDIESAMQLGPDGKVYLSLIHRNHLAVINFPNVLATSASPNACGFSYNGPSLITNTSQTISSQLGLPNMIDALPPAQVPADFSYAISSCSTVAFSAPSCATYGWNFGDGTPGSAAQNPTHAFTSDGTYTVTLTLNGTTTIAHQVTIGLDSAAATIYGPSDVCLSSGTPFHNYSVNPQPGLTYSWSVTGGTISGFANSDNVDVVWSSLPGTVQLTATDARGCTVTKTLTVTENCNPDPCLPRPPDLTGWWTFDEIIGNVAHDFAGAADNAGTYTNGPNPVAGLVGPALEFDGIDDSVQVADHPDLNFYGGCSSVTEFAEPLTIDVWVHANNTVPGPSSGLMTILDKRVPQPITLASGYHLFLFNGRLGFQVDGTNYVAPAAGPDYIDVADGQWHFVAVSAPTCRGVGNGFLYVDGRVVATFTRTSGFVNNASLYIGARDPAFGQNYFHGALDELEIFKRALTEDELRAIFEARSHGKCKADCSNKTITLGPATLPTLRLGRAYYAAAVLTASGGTAPYTFFLAGGSLPPGMTLLNDGSIAGVPGATGSFPFTVTAVDADGCRRTLDYRLTVKLGKRRAVR